MSVSLLPPEVLVKIFQQLPFTDRFRYRRVCILWNQILSFNDDVFKSDLGQIYANKDENCILVREDMKRHTDPTEIKSKLQTTNFDAALLAILERTASFLPSLWILLFDPDEDSDKLANDSQLWRDIVKVFERRNPVALHALDLWSWNPDTHVLANMNRMVNLCSSLRHLTLCISDNRVHEQDWAWSVLKAVPPIEYLKIRGGGFSIYIPSNQLLDTIHQQLSPSLKRLDWDTNMEDVGRFLRGFPLLQELGLHIIRDSQSWSTVFDPIIAMSALVGLSLTFDRTEWSSGATIGLKRLFDSSQRLKFIHLDSHPLDLPLLLDLLNHWSRGRSLYGEPHDLRVELGTLCDIRPAELAEIIFPAGVTIVLGNALTIAF